MTDMAGFSSELPPVEASTLSLAHQNGTLVELPLGMCREEPRCYSEGLQAHPNHLLPAVVPETFAARSASRAEEQMRTDSAEDSLEEEYEAYEEELQEEQHCHMLLPPPPPSSSDEEDEADEAGQLSSPTPSQPQPQPSPSREALKRIDFSSAESESDSPVLVARCSSASGGLLVSTAELPRLPTGPEAELQRLRLRLMEREEAMEEAQRRCVVLQSKVQEAQRLTSELCETKLRLAEQQAVLDRLGLHAPYPEVLVQSAVRAVRRMRQRCEADPAASLSSTAEVPARGKEDTLLLSHTGSCTLHQVGSLWHCLKQTQKTSAPPQLLYSMPLNQEL